MRNVLLFTVLAVTVSFTFPQISFAVCGGGPTVFVCDANPPNPDLMGVQQSGNNADLDVTMLPGAAINTAGQPGDLDGIRTGDGNNKVDLTDASILAQDKGIELDAGNDEVNVDGSSIETTDTGLTRALDARDGNNIINVTGGSTIISFDDEAISTGQGNDKIFVSDSSLTGGQGALGGGNSAIITADGDDMITVRDSNLRGNPPPSPSILAGSEDDMIRLEGVGSFLVGEIDCGDGFDTLVFALDVPEEALSFLSSELATKDPAGDSITINSLFYEWQNCEVILNELNGVPVVRPIPTLSEWGMIGLAVAMGVFGIFYALRRRAAADARLR